MLDREKIDEYPDLRFRFRMRIATRDHLIARKHGGEGYTVPCCLLCNQAKGARDPLSFRAQFRPHVPIEKVRAAMLEAKYASAALARAPRKKRATKRRRVII